MKRILSILLMLLIPLISLAEKENSGFSKLVNTHLIEESSDGFAVYRSGKPAAGDVKEWCKLGIRQAMVLAGNAEKHEFAMSKECPDLKVIYNQRQKAFQPLTAEFLGFFDKWIATARAKNEKILFRCDCGCHRAGRLAAYYEMKYMHKTLGEALVSFFDKGRNMHQFIFLVRQIMAMEDYIKKRPCRFGEKSYLCIK